MDLELSRRAFCALSLGFLPPGRAAAEGSGSLPAVDATAVVDRVQAFYTGATAYRAEFAQSHGFWLPQRGRVAFQTPRKMSWRFAGNGNRVVSDGVKLTVYEMANERMYHVPFERSLYPWALAFVFGGGDLRAALSFRPLAQRTRDPDGYILIASPKQPVPFLEQLFLYVDAATGAVRRVALQDKNGSRTAFRFFKAKLGGAVTPREFELSPPPGTTIIPF